MGGLDGTKARGEAEGEAFYKLLSLSIHSFSFLSKVVQLWRFRGLNVQKKLPWILWLHAFSIVSESRSVMSDSWQPHGLYSPWNSPDQNTGMGSLSPSPGDLPHPGIKPRSPTLQVDSFPAEPPGKPKNTGVGSLSLLQGIFPTQGSNPGLPRCRQILYQLTHEGSPGILEWIMVSPTIKCYLKFWICGITNF